MNLPSPDQPFVIDSLPTPIGRVPRICSALKRSDFWGTVRVRCGIGRMKYKLQPGLYALGTPDPSAPVLITANYKMSFDRLRAALPGRNAWILVLDTKGVNVWCSAGKGTFGTEELCGRIRSTGLDRVVAHRRLILPQLAGPGVAAHEVKRQSGFTVTFGPIRAEDVGDFLDGGLKAEPAMRRQTFPLGERAVLIPLELIKALERGILVLPFFFLVGGLANRGEFWTSGLHHGLDTIAALMGALAAGAVLTPLLLPWLPGRAFSLKGLGPGILGAAGFLAWHAGRAPDRLEQIGWLLMITAAAVYLALNFTGCSTYTSLSGVKKEMGRALPWVIGAGLAGLLLWLGAVAA